MIGQSGPWGLCRLLVVDNLPRTAIKHRVINFWKKKKEEKGSGDAFLEFSAAETLLEERLTVRQAQERPLGWTCLPALELAQEIMLSESGNSLTLVEVAWGPKGWALVADDLFWVFDLTIVVVREKEGMLLLQSLLICQLTQNLHLSLLYWHHLNSLQ